jgi:hypothetical protein
LGGSFGARTLTGMSDLNIIISKGERQGKQRAALFDPTGSKMHTSSMITILEDILITIVHVLKALS